MESTQASDDRALFMISSRSKQPPLCASNDGATAVGCIPISATVSDDGTCNNEFVIHYEGTMDLTQPVWRLYLLSGPH